MKHSHILAILALFMCSSPAFCQPRLSERIYLSTDKDAYVAGDMVWCSVFCLDTSTGRFSDFSGAAYVELHSSEGLAETGKAALWFGRGVCSIALPVSLPTGNYKLIAYTAQNRNEDFFDPDQDAKIISIFNTLTTEKVPGNVEIVSDEEYTASAPAGYKTTGPLEISKGAANGGKMKLSVANKGIDPASVSVSVYHKDAVLPAVTDNVVDFAERVKNAGKASYTMTRTPEYEGEIINVRVSGTDRAGIQSLKGKTVFISTPGEGSDMYTSVLDGNGQASFYTQNIYGDKDMVMEIEDLGTDVTCHLEILSPFYNPALKPAPALKMARLLENSLKLRGAGMQMEKNARTDSLYRYLPLFGTPLLNEECTTYRLDDYTRFPLMEEVITEFVSEMRVRSIDKDKDIRILMKDVEGKVYFSYDSSLMMLDGVPVLNHQKIIDYDPLLVSHINIFHDTYIIGKKSYSGIANFITYKRNMPGMQFDDNVRIVSFKGASYPVEYSCLDLPEEVEDYRQTIFWNPLVEIGAGEDFDFECRIPDYSGDFEVVVEGFTTSGAPICLHYNMQL